MNRWIKPVVLAGTHVGALALGFALGIYALPILIAPPSPAPEVVQSTADAARFTGEFRRDLADSDALHWGEGALFVGPDTIAFDGELAPGPDYRLYLSTEFVETEADFEAKRADMVQIGHVMTFDDFLLDVPHGVDPADYTTAIVWCETFGGFITAARYR